MWNFNKIEIHDFFSHADTMYEFKNNSCTVIVGENRDNGGNNGAGKSTIFEAIALALNNKTLRDLKKESFINRDAESSRLVLYMSNDVTKSTLEIRRTFFRGNKSAKVELIEDGELNSNITSVDEANKRIFELIGISREDLLRYFIISQDNNYTFFTAGDGEKKEVLNRITSADMINPLLDKLSSDKKAKEIERCEINEDRLSVEARKETLIEQVEELEQNSDTSQEIAELEERIEKYKNKKQKIKSEIAELEGQIKEKEDELECIVIPDTSELRKKIKTIKDKIKNLENKHDENERIYHLSEMDLDAKITCPHCNKDFIKDSQLDLSIDEINNVRISIQADNKNIQSQINTLNKKQERLQSQIDDVDELEERTDKIKRSIRKLKSNVSALQDEIKALDRKINKNTEEIVELREQKRNDVAIKTLKEKIKTSETRIQDLCSKLKSCDEELDMINYWNYYMGRSGFMTYMANKAVSVLEGTVNSFLKKFKSNLSVNINGFKILKDGSVREKIEVFALENGLNAEIFMSKSGGERGRINLAGVLAIQHLINMSSEGRGLNFLALDETFSGIDTEGQENVIRILENLGITVMMITQNVSSEFNNDNKLTIVKEDGVSRIK